jgi:hypothetical protein
MLSSAHCRYRVERLRLVLLVTTDPTAALRLRDIIARYRALADRARRAQASQLAHNKPSHRRSRKRRSPSIHPTEV